MTTEVYGRATILEIGAHVETLQFIRMGTTIHVLVKRTRETTSHSLEIPDEDAAARENEIQSLHGKLNAIRDAGGWVEPSWDEQ